MIDKVVVKGKTQGEKIYTAKLKLQEKEKQAWRYHHNGLQLYYTKNFKKAKQFFEASNKLLNDDYVTKEFINRCDRYIQTPPPQDWDGQEIITQK